MKNDSALPTDSQSVEESGTQASQVSKPPVAVEIEFDCIPLRSVSRFDVPMDASPGLERLATRLRDCAQKHGTHNAYFLARGLCTFGLTNDPLIGQLQFRFDGAVVTDEKDERTKTADLQVSLKSETCNWLNQSIVEWFEQTVCRAVEVEFDKYIQAGDLAKTHKRLAEIEQREKDSGGYLGMYL